MHLAKTLHAAVVAAVSISSLSAGETAPSAVYPHGVLDDPGWALARLNCGESPVTGEVGYRYPEASRPVRLYLIDSAIDNTGGWFDSCGNLTFVKNLRIVGGGSPPVPYDPHTEGASIDHGTRILSTIAGPERGAACGIPIELFSYDVYPEGGGGASNIALLISAISRATTEHEIAKFSNPDLLGVVCIANGTGEPTKSPSLLSAIDQALGVGLVVVVSAGNDNADVLAGNTAEAVINGQANACLTAAYVSSREGMINVGIATPDNTKSAISNYGSAVDLWSPGVNVLTFDPAVPGDGQSSPMQGTSPAAGLAAAAAIAELSRQPHLDPAGVENELKERLFAGAVSVVQIDDDLDDDGAVDELERFFGYDLNDPASVPPAPTFSVGEDTTELAFTIAASLWQPEDPMNLSDSSAWRLLASADMKNWTEVTTFLSVGEEEHGRVPVTVLAPKDIGLEEMAVSEGTTNSWVATPEQIEANHQLLLQLFENQKELFPDWYWDTLGMIQDPLGDLHLLPDPDPDQTVTPSEPPSKVFYRIEVIPNP